MASELFAKFTQSLSDLGRGDKINTLPSIVTQAHRVCSLEQFQNVQTSGDDSWVGFRLSTSPKLLVETVSCVGRSDFHLIGSDAVELPWEKVLTDAQSARLAQGEKITECPTEFETYIPDGATAVFALEVPTTGGVLLHCLSAYSIDVEGNRIDNGVNRLEVVKSHREALRRARWTIDSRSMNVSNDGASASFSGNVRFRDADFGIDCDELKVFFQDDENDASKKSRKVAKIEALRATCKINAFNQTASAEQIEYDEITGTFTLRGWPKVEHSGTKIEGTSRETVFKLDGKGKVSAEGPSKTVKSAIGK
jgi:lipopolysaccharide export system protein LptA